MHSGKIKGLEVTWSRAVRIWWGLAWRSGLYGLAAGLVLRLAGQFACQYFGVFDESDTAATLFGSLSGVIVSLFVMKHVLKKRYAKFSIFLVDNADIDEENPHAPWHGPVGRRQM